MAALDPGVAVIHAQRADRRGNARPCCPAPVCELTETAPPTPGEPAVLRELEGGTR